MRKRIDNHPVIIW